MALINLGLIEELSSHTRLQRLIVETDSYGWPSTSAQATNAKMYMTLMKSYFQAQNLEKQLKALHQICVDYTTGNLEKYRDKYEEWADGETPFDPFDDLQDPFDSGVINGQDMYVLPPAIEQYATLCVTVRSFAKLNDAKRAGFEEILGKAILPMDYEAQIKEVQIEYCLDGYNQFYNICTALIKEYREIKDAQACAREILKLYK